MTFALLDVTSSIVGELIARLTAVPLSRRTRGVNPYTVLWVRKLRVFGVQRCACVNAVAKTFGYT